MATEILAKALPSRALPSPQVDNQREGVPFRSGRYGAIYVVGEVRKDAILADEGSFFVANNAGTGLATVAAPTAFSDTAPLLTITNTDSPGNTSAKRIYLDSLRLTQTVVGTAGTGLQLQVKLDAIDRYSSAGTLLTPISPNMDIAKATSVATVRQFPTNLATGASARTPIGLLVCLYGMTAPLPAFSCTAINFGGVEGGFGGVLSATLGMTQVDAPPIIIGPGQTCVINFLIPFQSAASTWAAELAWWER